MILDIIIKHLDYTEKERFINKLLEGVISDYDSGRREKVVELIVNEI